MKKLLGILVLGLLWCNIVNSAKATCFGGECEFIFSVHYEWAETGCYQTMYNEEVETNVMSFTIVETGQECQIFDRR